MQRRRLAKRAWVVLFAAACVVYFYGLGAMPLAGADEPRYAQVAREMYERGDLVTPTLGGLRWFEKPALLYWLMMAGFSALGVTEPAARLPSAASGVACILLVAWAARRTEREAEEESEAGRNDARATWLGVACAAVCATCAGLLVFSRGASFDVILTAAVTLALSCFFVAELERDARRRRLLLAGFYAGVGLALLAKGLVGVVLPGGVVLGYKLLRREWPNPLRHGAAWGVPLALAVAALWYAPAYARNGWQFVDEFFVQHHFARYVSNKYQHPQPFYFYVPIVALLTLPWPLFVARGVGKFWRRDFKTDGAAEKLYTFALAWLVFPVLFFSASGSKLPGYVLPALPGAAILAGVSVASYLRGESGRGLMRATGALALFTGSVGLVYAYATGVVELTCALAVTAPAFVAGAFALLAADRRFAAFAALSGATLLTILLIISCALEEFARRESARGLMREAAAQGYAETLPVYQLHEIERTLEFYAAGRIAYAETGQPVKLDGPYEVVNLLRAGRGAALVIVPPKLVHQLTGTPELDARVVGDNGAKALVFVRLK
ncbi:MAG TPA: phospholipid carrier-dependent glycosyltransferase [Pyrinomonadaceae bacterium]|nr:phospholipid carrier-dependent glycosyltransferase [Pyrinomonadaceae bacterium]